MDYETSQDSSPVTHKDTASEQVDIRSSQNSEILGNELSQNPSIPVPKPTLGNDPEKTVSLVDRINQDINKKVSSHTPESQPQKPSSLEGPRLSSDKNREGPPSVSKPQTDKPTVDTHHKSPSSTQSSDKRSDSQSHSQQHSSSSSQNSSSSYKSPSSSSNYSSQQSRDYGSKSSSSQRDSSYDRKDSRSHDSRSHGDYRKYDNRDVS